MVSTFLVPCVFFVIVMQMPESACVDYHHIVAQRMFVELNPKTTTRSGTSVATKGISATPNYQRRH